VSAPDAIGALIVCARPDDRPETTVRSLLAQTAPPGDVVVLCDPAAPWIAQRLYRELGGRVRVLCAPGPLGGGSGLNVGTQLPEGDAVLVAEPGVSLAPDFLERLRRPLKDDPRVGLVGGVMAPPEAGRQPGVARGAFLGRSREPLDAPGDGLPAVVPVLSVPPEVSLLRRELLADVADEAGPFDAELDARHGALELGWRAWRAGWSAVVVTAARASVAHAPAAPAGLEARLAAIRSRHLVSLRHDRLSALAVDAPWLLAVELRHLLGLGLSAPRALLHLAREGTVARRRARARRRLDASRGGTWGAWRSGPPPRGVWRATRSGPSVSARGSG
jgi:GT2 family glycosyltransferase